MQISPTVNKVITFIYKNNLIEKNDNCLLAISGGVDSTSLFHIFLNVQKILKIKLGIAHINYNLRGEDSHKDEEYVKNLCEINKIPLYSKSINLKKILETEKISLEEKARNIRYDFFEEIANNNNFNKIILAHNSNDQTETILFKMIRGSISGLSGMETIRNYSKNNNLKIVRPLLCLTRFEIEEYCKKNNLTPRIDLSNYENDYTRNRIRNKILPLILEENPNFLEITSQMSSVLEEENKFLDKIAKENYFKIFVSKDENKIILSDKGLKTFDVCLQRRIIRIAYEELTKDINFLTYKHLVAIQETIQKSESGKIIELPNNYYFIKDKLYLIFYKDFLDLSIKEFQYNFNLFEKINIDDLSLSFNTEKSSSSEMIKSNSDFIHFSLDNFENVNLTIKNYSPKEKFLPFGKKQETSLKDYLDKKKIPDIERKGIGLLYVNNKLLWIINIARSNYFTVDNNSKNVIVAKCKII